MPLAVCHEIGAWTACDDDFYSGKGDDATKRAHFKDTTRAWFWADVVIATSTLSVNLRDSVSAVCSFLINSPLQAKQNTRLRESSLLERDRDSSLYRHIFIIRGKEPKTRRRRSSAYP